MVHKRYTKRMTHEETDPLLADPDESPKDTPPPKPRAAGAHSHVNDEDKLVAQIEAENKDASFEADAEAQREHESAMLVIGEKKKSWLNIFKRPKFWFSLLFFMFVGLTFTWLITPSRLWLLNTIGQRAEVTVTAVVATADGMPPVLKHTTVVMNGQTFQTDDQGQVRARLPYGPLKIEASKTGYESVTQNSQLDLDPFFNALGGTQADTNARNPVLIMKNVGVTIAFTALDWLSGQPITLGDFSIGDVVAHPDVNGKVVLTIPATDEQVVQATASFQNDYTNTQVTLIPGVVDQETAFIVPVGKHYFVSKRSGQFAVYSSKLDGSEVAEVVPQATGETGDITFSASPDAKYGILGSTREATRDNFGTVQQKLFVVDLATNKLRAVDTALRFDLVDWSGNTLVYVASFRGGDGQMVQRLGSIDAAKAKQTTIGVDTTYKTVRVCLNSVVYLRADEELRTVPVAGGIEKTLGAGVKQLTQLNATTYAYQIVGWHSYDVNANQVANAQTPTTTGRAFLAARSGDGQSHLVADMVDGMPTLFAKAVGNGQEVKLFAGSTVAAPIRWIGNVAIYRVGSADYAVSPRGGQPKKITDVTPSSNIHTYPSFN